jgi:hypothetical protein
MIDDIVRANLRELMNENGRNEYDEHCTYLIDYLRCILDSLTFQSEVEINAGSAADDDDLVETIRAYSDLEQVTE